MNAGRVVVLGLFILCQFIRAQPTFERDFSLNDPLIQHPHTSEQYCLSLRSLQFDHLHEPGYKNPKLYKQPDCRSGACHTRYRRRGIQKLVTRTSSWLACSNFWQVRRTTRQDVESIALIIYIAP